MHQMSMNARKDSRASVMAVAARIHGADSTASAKGTICTYGEKTHASVRNKTSISGIFSGLNGSSFEVFGYREIMQPRARQDLGGF